MPEKTELKKLFKDLYSAKAEPSLVNVPAQNILAIDGKGDPNNSERFESCIEALFTTSYILKFAFKKEKGLDWTVLGLEGDWWCGDMSQFSMSRKNEWEWTLLIVQPDFITESDAKHAIESAKQKKKHLPIAEIRLEKRQAHKAAHILHTGPFDLEPQAIERLHCYIKAQKLELTGIHREIYLSDKRKVAPEKMRTILRQPVLDLKP